MIRNRRTPGAGPPPRRRAPTFEEIEHQAAADLARQRGRENFLRQEARRQHNAEMRQLEDKFETLGGNIDAQAKSEAALMRDSNARKMDAVAAQLDAEMALQQQVHKLELAGKNLACTGEMDKRNALRLERMDAANREDDAYGDWDAEEVPIEPSHPQGRIDLTPGNVALLSAQITRGANSGHRARAEQVWDHVQGRLPTWQALPSAQRLKMMQSECRDVLSKKQVVALWSELAFIKAPSRDLGVPLVAHICATVG